MQTDSLKYKSLKNASYNMAGYVWALIFSAFITPIIVLGLGIQEYGIFIFINTIISLLGLIDLGISTAATKYIAEYQAADEHLKLRSFIYSLNTLYLVMGIIGFLFFMVAAILGYAFFSTQIPDYHLFFSLFIFAGGIFFVNAINSVYTIIPLAFQRFDISNKIGVIQLALSQLTILILVLMGYKLNAIFISQLLYAIIFSIIFFRSSLKLLPSIKLKLSWNAHEIKRCYKFGLGTTLHTTASSSLSYLDRLIIPFFLGPAQLTYYTLPGSVAAKVPGISNTLAGILFPMTSSLHGCGNTEGIEKLYTRSFRLITILSAAMTSSIIYFAEPIMRYWLNEDFARNSTSILIILALTNFILALSGPLSGFLLGLGKLRFLTISSVSMAILNIVLLVVLMPAFGITGAAFAYLLSLLPVIYLFYHTEHMILRLSDRLSHYSNLFLRIILVGATSYIIHLFLILPFIKSFTAILFAGPLSVLLFLVLYRIFGFYEQEDWEDLRGFLNIALRKIPFQKHKNR